MRRSHEESIPVPVAGLRQPQPTSTLRDSPRCPHNLTQAQRDAFGAHTYERLDHPGVAVHTEWLA